MVPETEGERSEIMEWLQRTSHLFDNTMKEHHLIKLQPEKGGDEVGTSGEIVHVLTIVGNGDVGKTTLA